MRVKLSELENLILPLQSIMKKKVPVKMSYAINKNVKHLTEEYEMLMEQREKIYSNAAKKDEYGKPIIEDGQYTFETDEQKNQAVRTYIELLDTEVEVETMKIDMDELEKCDTTDKYDALTGIEAMTVICTMEE